MSFAAAEAGRANLANRDDADAWAFHAREQTKRDWNGGDGQVQAHKYKSCRRWVSSIFFGIGYGLMLWNMGYLGAQEQPTGDMKLAVWAACAASYVLFAIVVAFQIKRGEIFVRSAGGINEGHCCGVKWSSLLGYVFLLAVVALMIWLPFWVGKSIIACIKDASISCADQAGDIGFVSAGVFSVLAVLLGLREIVKHWLNYFKPHMQRHVVRVLWMVPIYALDAMYTLYLCFGRLDEDGNREGCDHSWARLVGETLREFYEAYTIYAFFCYLVECLHQEAKDLALDDQDNSAEGIRARMEAAAAGGHAQEATDDNMQTALLASEAGGASGGASSARRTVNDRVSHDMSGRVRGGFVVAQGMDEPEKLYQLLRDTNPDGMKHEWMWGLGWMNEWEMGEEWLQKCWKGVLQYVILQVLFALTIAITRSIVYDDNSNAYGEGCLTPWVWNNDDADAYKEAHGGQLGTVEQVRATNPEYRLYRCGERAYPYTTLIISLSQMYALYCLVFFYHGTAKPLKRIKPLAKFISIKMIVFFSYWQGLGLSMVEGSTDLLDGPAIFLGLCEDDGNHVCKEHGGTESLSTGIQAVLICIEMFAAALAHRTVFSYRDYRDRLTDTPELGFCGAAAHSMNNKVLVAMSKDYVRYEVGAVRVVADATEQVLGAAVDAAETVGDHMVGGDRLIRAESDEQMDV
jgi:hypothetical protein